MHKFQEKEKCLICDFAEALDFMVRCCLTVEYSLAHTKACEILKFKSPHQNNQNYENFLTLNKAVCSELEKCKKIGAEQNFPVRSPVFILEMFSDAPISSKALTFSNY